MRPPSASTRLQRAQAAAEFALILPVVALMGMGIVDLGRAFYTYEALINAAREGARFCALNPGSNALYQRVVSSGGSPDTAELLGRFPGAAVAARLETAAVALPTCPSASGGDDVRVIVSAPFSPITPLIDRITGNPVTIRGTAVMTVWQ